MSTRWRHVASPTTIVRRLDIQPAEKDTGEVIVVFQSTKTGEHYWMHREEFGREFVEVPNPITDRIQTALKLQREGNVDVVVDEQAVPVHRGKLL